MRLHSLYDIVQVAYRLVMLFWWEWRYTVDVLYCRCVYPFACCGDRYHFIHDGLSGKCLDSGTCLEIGGLSSPLSDVLVKGGCLYQNCDPFGHHHIVDNSLPYCTRKLSSLLKVLD